MSSANTPKISGIYDEMSFPTSQAFLKNPDPRFVNFRDIAASLSKLCMFNGNTHTFYSVAQFSILLSDIVHDYFTQDKKVQLQALLYLSPHKYTGYVAETFEEQYNIHFLQTRQNIVMAVYNSIELADLKTIKYNEHHFIWSSLMKGYATVKRDMVPENNYPDLEGITAYRHPIQADSMLTAEQKFLKRLTNLITASGLQLPDELELFDQEF